MKDDLQMTRKQLKLLATNLEAQSIAKDVFRYENAIDELIRGYHKLGIKAVNNIVAYSAGVYGTNGRIDKITLKSDCIVKGRTEFFVCCINRGERA